MEEGLLPRGIVVSSSRVGSGGRPTLRSVDLRRRVLIAMAVAVPILAIGIGLVALGVSVWVVRPLVVIAALVLFIPLTRSRD